MNNFAAKDEPLSFYVLCNNVMSFTQLFKIKKKYLIVIEDNHVTPCS